MTTTHHPSPILHIRLPLHLPNLLQSCIWQQRRSYQIVTAALPLHSSNRPKRVLPDVLHTRLRMRSRAIRLLRTVLRLRVRHCHLLRHLPTIRIEPILLVITPHHWKLHPVNHAWLDGTPLRFGEF